MAAIIQRIVETYDDGSINEWTPAEQVRDCCQEIPGADECTEEGKVETWNGYPQSNDDWDPEDRYRAAKLRIGDRLIGYKVINSGGPENGQPCGTQHTRWTGTLGCCDYPVSMYWGDGTFPKAVEIDTTYDFSISGGTVPISYSVVGSGVTIIAESDDLVRVRTDTCLCKPVLLVATDSCGEQVIKILSLSDGSWDEIAQEAMWSVYGWGQNGKQSVGEESGIIVYGFNSDLTKYSKQGYAVLLTNNISDIQSAHLTTPDYSSTALVIPVGYGGFSLVDGQAVFWKDVTDDPASTYNLIAYIAQDIYQATYEYTPGTCEDELVYDDENSGDIIADYSDITVMWEGGVGPFLLTFNPGYELYFDKDYTLTEFRTTGRATKIYAKDSCGRSYVRITDSCGSTVEGTILSPTGQWYYQGTPETCMLTEDDGDATYTSALGVKKKWSLEKNGIKQDEYTGLSKAAGDSIYIVDGPCPDPDCSLEGCLELEFIAGYYELYGQTCFPNYILTHPNGYPNGFPTECGGVITKLCYCGWVDARYWWIWGCTE